MPNSALAKSRPELTQYQFRALECFSFCNRGDAGVSIADIAAWADIEGFFDRSRLVRVVKACEAEANLIRKEEMDRKKPVKKSAARPRPAVRKRR